MKGKEKEMDSRKGRLPNQPSINPCNISSHDSNKISLLNEDSEYVYAIMKLRNGKQKADPYDKKHEKLGKEQLSKEDEN